MKVLVLAQGPASVASSRTRVFAYLPFLAAAGVAADVLVWNSQRFVDRSQRGAVPVTEHVRNTVHQLRALRRLLRRARGANVVYVQKVVLPGWCLAALARGGRRLVFDYDDALYATVPGHDRGLRGSVRRARVRRLVACLSRADVVVLENEPNRAYAERHCRQTLTITGPIDTDRYRPAGRRAAGDEVVLGWIGSPSTTGYLRMLDPVLAALAARGRRVALHLIGAGPYESRHVPVRHVPWTLASEVAALETLNVGVMPLTDDPWARGKGGYKILQYMAMGIPTVASPVGINAEMVRPGVTGFLAADQETWVTALEALIVDAELRARIGAQARACAVERYSLAHAAPVLLDALFPARPPAAVAAPRVA